MDAIFEITSEKLAEKHLKRAGIEKRCDDVEIITETHCWTGYLNLRIYAFAKEFLLLYHHIKQYETWDDYTILCSAKPFNLYICNLLCLTAVIYIKTIFLLFLWGYLPRYHAVDKRLGTFILPQIFDISQE